MWECNAVVATLCVSGAVTKNLPRERGRVGEREKELWREKTTAATPHLVDFPRIKNKNTINPTSTAATAATAPQISPFFPQRLRVKIYENQFSTNTCLSVQTRTNETAHTIFKPEQRPAFLFSAGNFFTIFHPTSAPLKSSQLAVLDTTCRRVCMCVCAIKKSV